MHTYIHVFHIMMCTQMFTSVCKDLFIINVFLVMMFFHFMDHFRCYMVLFIFIELCTTITKSRKNQPSKQKMREDRTYSSCCLSNVF